MPEELTSQINVVSEFKPFTPNPAIAQIIAAVQRQNDQIIAQNKQILGVMLCAGYLVSEVAGSTEG